MKFDCNRCPDEVERLHRLDRGSGASDCSIDVAAGTIVCERGESVDNMVLNFDVPAERVFKVSFVTESLFPARKSGLKVSDVGRHLSSARRQAINKQQQPNLT